jgi:CTP:molybdopterin cytidylyltransferase MocA
MIDSLRLGLASVEAAAYLVWPVDCPLVTLQAVHALCSFPCRQAAVPYYLGRAGHPVLLPGTARTAIEACASLREHLSLASSLQRVEVNDAGVLSNLNSLADNADA